MKNTYSEFYKELAKQIDRKRIFQDPLYTHAFGADASLYRLIPQIVVKTENENEVSYILKTASKHGIPVTFRAAGTSLSGQAVSDSVLLLVGDKWKKFKILENGHKITVQPALTGAKINKLLSPFGRKIGPDPASIDAATIGGIVANNSSGMSSGIIEDAFTTLESMRIIMADGSVLDTGNEESKNQFLNTHGSFIHDISRLAESVRENTALANRIRQKYKMKNTTGYSLHSLTNYTDPFRIIEHLLIGSEGTLGFISEITLRTVPEYPFKASALMIFGDLEKACNAVMLLKSTPVEAVELIDRAGLRSVENESGMPEYLKKLSEDASAILVETVASSKEVLNKNIEEILASIKNIETELAVNFTDIPEEYAEYWNIRKGLFPSVGAMREKGTTVIIEDVTLPMEHLAAATLDLQKLLKKFEYHGAVIYGHALEGNLHFVFSQNFGTEKDIERYDKFMHEVVELIVHKYDGALKAEHGTGRNIAPFVETEWGSEAYEVMKKIKNIFDPLNVLNPGVILNSDPKIHLKNLKPIPRADDIIDKCIECGFCEPSCVSAELTLTPRQRIVVYREIIRRKSNGHEPHILASLQKGFTYAGDQTCATDGLCAISCPVKIDTGTLIKKIRSQNIEKSKNKAIWIADHMRTLTSFARTGLNFLHFFHILFGSTLMRFIATGLRKISAGKIPQWNSFMPKGAKRINMEIKLNESKKSRKMVYFPSCINRSMGVSKDHREEVQLTEKMISLIQKAGYEIIFPENLDNLCCGMAFLSKGFTEAGLKKSRELESALLKASNNGEYPVLCDMSPCLFTMKENMAKSIKLYEPVEFINEYLLPWLMIKPIDETVTVFPVCSMKKMGLEQKLVELAKKCATEVIVPETNCCGFAGDRGFSYPELNKHGLRNLREQIPSTVKHGYSTSRTCEIGLSLHSGISHKSIVYLVDKVTQPLDN